MKGKILASLLAIALISGCAGISIPGVPGLTPGTPIVGGKGLEITTFTAEPSALYSNATVRIIMEVENQGGTTVPNTTSTFAYLTGSNIKLSGGESDTMYWRGVADVDKSDCKYFPRNMTPADVVKGTTGSKANFRWNLIAPTLSAGQVRSDSFIGRVYTIYSTGVNGNIWAYKETEADAARAAGRALSKSSFTSTSGPVAVEVSSSPDPIIVYGSDRSFSLNIKISNLASGTIFNPDKSPAVSCTNLGLNIDDLNKVSVSITAPDFSGIGTCTGQQELVAGRPTTLICDVSITNDFSTFKSFPISINVKYGYYTERTASVTVQGK